MNFSITKNIKNKKLRQFTRRPFAFMRDEIRHSLYPKLWLHPTSYLWNNFNKLFRNSHSQFQEDLIIDKLLKYKENGFYVDIGANDPVELSNTIRFYRKGWNGINVEPNVLVYNRLCEERKNDINLNIGIAQEKGEFDFYRINPDVLSTFDKQTADDFVAEGYKLVEVIKVSTLSLENLISTYATDKKIDFLSVDTEGIDLIVLKSNNWEKYRPTVVIVEIDKGGDEIIEYLNEKNYELKFKNHCNAIFIDKNI